MKRYTSKLIVSSGTLSSGGAERVLSILSDRFVEHYDEVVYLTWIDIPDFYTINKAVKRVCVERECGSKNLFRKALWFRQFVKQEKPNVVLSFLAPFNILICFALTGIRTKLIVAERNDPRNVCNGRLTSKLRKMAYSMADGILEQTENNKKYFHGKLYKKTDVIYNPIIMDDEFVGKALACNKKKKIVSVARLTEQKNQKMLLLAFKAFLLTHPGYKLIIFGEGPYRSQLEKIVLDLGLNESVELPGAVKDVWNKIVDAECFVLSSWFEGMPNALLEAMCLGLPCISTKVSGAVDLIRTGENGILVDLDDHEQLAGALCNLIDNKFNQQVIGKNATQLYELLHIDSISKQWVEYIDNIMYK